jgi:iron complex outermembrane receptor protein
MKDARRESAETVIASDRRDRRRLNVSALALLPAIAAAHVAAADAPVTTAPPEVSEVVVNGIPFKETVLPTRLSTSSVYGLDLSVMDTPRNSTLLSTTQLETLNIQDPRAFSYLTASSYSDSSFGTPNIPRIRGQYSDVYYNGMRLSFTQNGYGAPPNFDVLDTISITKGPASVIDGAGPGVGGQVDFITKRPSLTRDMISAEATFDTVGNRRWSVDAQGPLIRDELGARLSYSGEDSGSWFYDHFHRKEAGYLAVRWEPNTKYRLDFNGEINWQQYTENVGVNRVNQNLIDHDQYLQGVPDGECFSTFATPCAPPGQNYPIGSPGNPFSPVVPILTQIDLTNSVPLNTRITIDQAPGVWSQALTFNTQLIQSYEVNDHVTLENNTFVAYQNSENREPYYYADASLGSWTFENRADAKFKFDTRFGGLDIASEIIVGATFRFAHVDYISDFSAETPGVFDLTTNPNLWVWDNAVQVALADAFPYKTSWGATQYGVPGRDSVSLGNDGVSDLYDTGFFFQHRMEFSPQFSVLYGGRFDMVQNHSHDPLGGAICENCFTGIYYAPDQPLPEDHTTGVYGLGQGNVRVVYKPQPWVSTYVTFDFTQSTNPNGGEGGVNTFLQVPDHVLMRSDSYLYEAGSKFNLLNNKLFAGIAGFDQKRAVPTGAGGNQFSQANIRGVEFEANYQPTRNLYATASYSYIKTTLNTAAGFYNYPAEPGENIDGAGLFAVFAPGQKFDDPGVPRQIFNFLVNYKFDNGIGLRYGVQAIGPIATTTSGQLCGVVSPLCPNVSEFVPLSVQQAGYYYKSPVIPWQYTMNASVFYEWKQYTATVSVYNFTNQLNWNSAPTFYGNDFLVRNDPLTVEFRLQAKFR